MARTHNKTKSTDSPSNDAYSVDVAINDTYQVVGCIRAFGYALLRGRIEADVDIHIRLRWHDNPDAAHAGFTVAKDTDDADIEDVAVAADVPFDLATLAQVAFHDAYILEVKAADVDAEGVLNSSLCAR